MTETEGKIMKKILIATTALVATAGVAAADVKLSGYARFGMQYTEGTDGAEDSTDVVSRARIQADASTTTDAGLGLSYRQRFQTEENSTGGLNGARFGVSYEGVMIQAGNICGVIECTPGLYMGTNSAGIGLEGQSWHSLAANIAGAGAIFNWTAYSSGGAGATNGVEVMYNANGLGLHLHSTETTTGIGASYSISNIKLAAARETQDATDDAPANEITLVTAGLDLGMGGVGVAWAENAGLTKTVIKADYDMAPGANIHAFMGSEDAGESYGIGVNYGLGGGASFDAGVDSTSAGQTRISAGLFFKF
jgi:outer membrane protein OmpU